MAQEDHRRAMRKVAGPALAGTSIERYDFFLYGTAAALLSELFGTEVRYSGASPGYQLGAIAGGGLAPIIATALLARQGGTLGISVYIAGAAAMTVASMLALRETYRDSLHG